MKIWTFVFFTFFMAGCSKNAIQSEELYLNLSDLNLETLLIDSGIDSEGLTDGKILKSDVLSTTHLKLTNLEAINGEYFHITDLRYFENLTFLEIRNRREPIDLSANQKLDTLRMSYYYAQRLDLSKNTNLKALYLSASQLKTLDLSQNINLSQIEIFDIPLTSLIVNATLQKMVVSGTRMKSLDLTHCYRLKYLSCPDSYLESLDLSQNGNLDYVNLTYNYLRTLILPTRMCQDAIISELHIEKNRNYLKKICVCDEYQANANKLRKLYIPYYYWTYAWTTDENVVFEECKK